MNLPDRAVRHRTNRAERDDDQPAPSAATSDHGALGIECGGLPVLSSPELLDPGEALHADVEAFGWRYEAVDVAYETRRVLAVGGPVMFAVTAAASLIGNGRAQAGAQRLAAPQWRPLGDLRILATNERLLVFHQGGWASVWYRAIRQAHPLADGHRLELIFDADPPTRCAAPRSLT